MNKITVSRGEVVGIGKLKIYPSNDFPHEIPMLSFLVIAEARDVFVATCIHFHIDGDGFTAEEALKAMQKNVIEFLYDNFEGNRKDGAAWENIKDLFLLTKSNSELWDAYRILQVYFAREGVETDATSDLMGRIDALQDNIAHLSEVVEKQKNKDGKKIEVGIETHWVAA